MGVRFDRVRDACVGFTCHHPTNPYSFSSSSPPPLHRFTVTIVAIVTTPLSSTPPHDAQGGFGVLNQVLDSTIFESLSADKQMDREQLFHCKVGRDKQSK